MGRTMLSKSLIQLSVDGRGCVPSLLCDPRPNYGQVMKITATSFTRSCAPSATLRAPDPAAGHPDPHPRWRLLDTHRQVWVSLLWGHWPFCWVLVCIRFCLCPSRVCLPSPVLSSVIKSHCSPKSNSLGVLSSSARSPGWDICCGS